MAEASATDQLTQMLPLLLLCCMLPMLTRGGDSQSGAGTTEMDIWFTGYTPQEAYDNVVKETDIVREKAITDANSKKSKLPSLPFMKKKKEYLTVEQTIPPNLYRLTDKEYGPMHFEFSDAEGGGTQVKATFSLRNKYAVQDIKAKMPGRKLMVTVQNTSTCPSCGKNKLPEWKICPYCGAKFG